MASIVMTIIVSSCVFMCIHLKQTHKQVSKISGLKMLQSLIEGNQWWWSEILSKNYKRYNPCIINIVQSWKSEYIKHILSVKNNSNMEGEAREMWIIKSIQFCLLQSSYTFLISILFHTQISRLLYRFFRAYLTFDGFKIQMLTCIFNIWWF